MIEHKIIITGSMGAGKTTAIAAVSETPPIVTDVQNNDTGHSKLTTTVGLDYGELTLENGDKLRLYGTPGQARFAFMWRILAKGALGVIILVDNTEDTALDDIESYVTSFADVIDQSCCVVGIGRTEARPTPTIDDYADRLTALGVLCPVVPVDVRDKSQVLMLLDLLLTQLEHKLPA